MRIFGVLLTVLALAAFASAQEAQVAVEKPPYYVGEPVVVRIIVDGLEESPQPVVELASPAPELRMQLAAASPRVSSSMHITRDPVTGRQKVNQQKSIIWPLDYHVTADTPGKYQVGPFVVKQGARELRAEAITLTFGDVPLDESMRVRLVLPEGPIYPDQRVPVTIEWWYAGDPGDISKLSIYSPIFDEFTFAPDERPTRQSSQLPIETRKGRLALAASAQRETQGGKSHLVLSARRTLIPDRSGEFSLPPITATIRRVTRWARERSPFDGFGGSFFDGVLGDRRQPAETELGRAVGERITLTVKPFPSEGKPPSFAGAVGEGFSLDVTADRTVVRVGDPIRLTVSLHGEGNIENASLPTLAAAGGLDPRQFRVPAGETRGAYENGVKKFDVTVRVQDIDVSEIPAIDYSWFDPEEGTYRTAQSDPIALRVMPSKMVTPADVFSGANENRQQGVSEGSKEVALANSATAEPGETASSLSLSGADLSIERDAGVLLRDSRNAWSGSAVQYALYAAGLAILAVALIDRKRRDIPDDVIRRRKLLSQQRRRIALAAKQPQRKAAEEVAAVMRQFVAEIPDAPRDGADQIIAECESLVYAPNATGTERLSEALLRRATEVADQFTKEAE